MAVLICVSVAIKNTVTPTWGGKDLSGLITIHHGWTWQQLKQEPESKAASGLPVFLYGAPPVKGWYHPQQAGANQLAKRIPPQTRSQATLIEAISQLTFPLPK